MPRLRETDFGEVQTHDGIACRSGDAEAQPFYVQAERMYWVHGDQSDPTGPWRSAPVAAAPPRASGRPGCAAARTARAHAVLDADRRRIAGRADDASSPHLRLVSRSADVQGDAEVSALGQRSRRVALGALLTEWNVRTIRAADDGSRITGTRGARDSRDIVVTASRYVVAAGAVNTAALLLRSRTASACAGLANSSDQVGRNYMPHTKTFVLGVRPGRARDLVFEKTLGINDWYDADRATRPTREYPVAGQVATSMIKPKRERVPRPILDWMTERSIQFFVETEDLPMPSNRVGPRPLRTHSAPVGGDEYRATRGAGRAHQPCPASMRLSADLLRKAPHRRRLASVRHREDGGGPRHERG